MYYFERAVRAFFLRAFALSRKAHIIFVVSVPLSGCISAAPIGRIFVKFNMGDFWEMPWENPKSVKIGQKCRGALRGDLSTFCVAGDIKFAIKAFLCRTQCFCAFTVTCSTQAHRSVSTATWVFLLCLACLCRRTCVIDNCNSAWHGEILLLNLVS
jgi:hypothetical protein